MAILISSPISTAVVQQLSGRTDIKYAYEFYVMLTLIRIEYK